MNTARPLKVLSERELTPDENLWLDMRAEAIKQTPGRVSDTLTRLVTLTTALAAGAIGILKDDVSTGWGRILAATFFFAALLSAVVGSLPKTAIVPTFPVANIQDAIRRVIGFKESCARLCLGLLAAGLLATLLGMAFHVPAYRVQSSDLGAHDKYK